MGEARRRAAALADAKSRLRASIAGDGESGIVAETALTFFERFIHPRRYTGGCYLTTMFLHRYLTMERGLEVDPIVGYVNDGTDRLMISHAWIEHRGRKVDLTLHLLDENSPAVPGELLVLDQPIRPGATYSYHTRLDAAGEEAHEELVRAGGLAAALMQHKRLEHDAMSIAMSDPLLMVKHQASAPPGLGYEDMRAVLP